MNKAMSDMESPHYPVGYLANPFTDMSLRERLHLRTCEIARIQGRGSFEITQKDYEQAKRDVTGEKDPDRQNAILDGIARCSDR